MEDNGEFLAQLCLLKELFKLSFAVNNALSGYVLKAGRL